MSTFIKTVRILENTTEKGSLEERSLSDDEIRKSPKCVRVFDVKQNDNENAESIESTTNGKVSDVDIECLRTNFSKKLDVNNKSFSDEEALQISRGPQGGKPSSHSNPISEHEPPLKFVRPFWGNPCFPMHSMPIIYSNQFNNTNTVSYLETVKGNSKHVEDINRLVRSTFAEIPDKCNFKTAGEVFQENGMAVVEPTHFTILNPNTVCDEHGQIIQHNNKRKIGSRMHFEQCNNEFNYISPMFVSSSSPQNNIRSNPCSNSVKFEPAQFNLTIQNFSSDANLQQKQMNFDSSNCGRRSQEIIPYSFVSSSQLQLQSCNEQTYLQMSSNVRSENSQQRGNLFNLQKSLKNADIGTLAAFAGNTQSSNGSHSNLRSYQQRINDDIQSDIPHNYKESSEPSNSGIGCTMNSSFYSLNGSKEIHANNTYPEILNFDTILNILSKTDSSCDNREEKQLDMHRQTSNAQQRKVSNEIGQQTSQNMITSSKQMCENLYEIDLGLDSEVLQNLIQEFQNGFDSDVDWSFDGLTDEHFKQSESALVAPSVNGSEINIYSPSDSLSSSTQDSYDFVYNPISDGFKCPNLDLFDSCHEKLESFEIHPDMLQSLFRENSNTHENDFIGYPFSSETSELAVKTFTTPLEKNIPIDGSMIDSKITPFTSVTGFSYINNEVNGGEQLTTLEDSSGITSFQYANYSEEDLVRQDEDGDNLLHIAVINDNPEIIENVLERLKSKNELRRKIIEAKNSLCQTPLCLAVVENQPMILNKLIRSGADGDVPILSRKDRSFSRPLHFAASKGHLWMECLMELLACQNVEVNSLDSEGKTPLLCAVKSHCTTYKGKTINSIPSIELLVDKGADLNKADGCFDMTALHYAIASKSLNLVSCLISLASARYYPNKLDNKYPSGVSTLNTMLSAKTGTGYSALHLAVSLNIKDDGVQLKIIQLLLSKGADPSSKNAEGQLPRELTKNKKVIELLKGIGLRRKPSSLLSSPSQTTDSCSPGARSVISQGHATSTNGQFSSETPSPIYQII